MCGFSNYAQGQAGMTVFRFYGLGYDEVCMIRVGLRIKHAAFICCFILIFMCTVNVQAAEEGISPPVSVKVYSEMSENSNVVANLIAGNTFQVTEKVSDDAGIVWYSIRTDMGTAGYVKADEMKRLNTDKQALQQQTPRNVENSEPDGTDAKDLEKNESAKSDADEDVSNENVFEDEIPDSRMDGNVDGEVIALAPLNLRRMPSANAERVSKVKQGTRLPCIQKLVNDAGESWYKVEYNGMEGYVIAKAVKFEKKQHSDEEKTESETEHTATDDADNEKNSETEVSSEEIVQKEESVQKEQQPEHQSVNTTQFVFAVDEEPTAPDIHNRREIDWMLIALITGGILCIVVIVIFLMKIRKLRRE